MDTEAAHAAVFRTVTIRPETSGRVAETFFGINEIADAGQPLFKLDDTAQRAAVDTATLTIAEIEARLTIAEANLRESERRIAQANDECQTRLELLNRSWGAVSEREVRRAQWPPTRQGLVHAMILRLHAAVLPIQTLALRGH